MVPEIVIKSTFLWVYSCLVVYMVLEFKMVEYF